MAPRDKVLPYPESSVDVELLTPGEFDAMTRPKPVETAPPLPSAAPSQAVPDKGVPGGAAPSGPGGMIRASRLMAADALANPLSKQARDMLPLLAEDERVEQLCALEAMSQIHAWKGEFEPDRVSAYAKAETKISGQALLAEGAVFRSRRHWYDLRFKCEFSPDRTTVLAFEFRVGDPVPRGRWRKLGLPEIH
jgi:hypothetical protein